MKKLLRIILNTIASILLFFIVLPLFVSLIFQINFVQNFIIDRLTEKLSTKLETEISIKRIDLKLFYNAYVEGFYVQDPIEKDTLLYVDNLSARLKGINLLTGKVTIDNINLQKGKFFLNNDSTLTMNIKYITQKLKRKDKKEREKRFKMDINSIIADSVDFQFRKYGHRIIEAGINFQDMEFKKIATRINNFRLIGDSINMSIDSIHFTEKSGTVFDNVKTKNLTLSPNIIRLTDLRVRIDRSWIDMNNFSLHFHDWTMTDFIQNVTMKADVLDSRIDFRTVAQFTGRKRPWKSVVSFAGSREGTIDNMAGLVRKAQTHTTLLKDVTFVLRGLPDIRNTLFNIDIPQLSCSLNDVGSIYTDFTGKQLADLSKYEQLSPILFNGSFNGFISDYESKGKLATALGTVNLNINNEPIQQGFRFNGNLNTSGFELGHLFRSNDMGQLSLNADIDATITADSANINTQTLISDFSFKDYHYKDIEIDGDFVNKTFLGYIGCKDPNIDFDFNGFVEFDESLPTYDFKLSVREADLYTLNLNKRDSISLLSGNIIANGSGSNLDNLNGNIEINGLKYINPVDTINAGQITITTQNDEQNKSIKFNSNFADIELRGQQSYYNIFPYLKNTIQKYLPSLQETNLEMLSYSLSDNRQESDTQKKQEPENIESAKNSYYVVNLNVKEANNVAGIFLPGLNVAEGTKLSFLFNPAIDQFSFSFNSEYINRGNTLFSNINIDTQNVADSISLFARADEIILNRLYVPNLSILGGIKNNNINIYSRFSNKDDGTSAFIAMQSVIRRNETTGTPQIRINLQPSYITFNNQTWQTNTPTITIDSAHIHIPNFNISSGVQNLAVNGDISRQETDTLAIKLSNFNLAPLSRITDRMGYQIGGTVDGNVRMISVMQNMYFLSQIDIKSLTLNGHQFQDAIFRSAWAPDDRRIYYTLNTQGSKLIDGHFTPKTKHYFAQIDIPNIDISLISPFLQGIMEDTRGTGHVKVTASNPDGYFALNGTVEIPEFTATIAFTKVRYTVSGTVDVKDNQFTLRPGGKIVDESGTEAPLDVWLTNTRFKNVNYFIGMHPSRMLCMNTSAKDNDLFYGTIYASGDVAIRGRGKRVTMDVTATTDAPSTFSMPLSDKSTMTEADFITFVSREEPQEVKRTFILNDKKKNKSQGSFDMNMNVTVLPNTYAQIVIDPTIGDIIKGRGTGQFVFHARPKESIFTINGGYEIEEGNYLFTLSNIINKYFTIREGSTITWTGDPLQANLNITATYNVKTSLAPLLGNEPTYRRRVDVDCNMTLTGQLLRPDIQLGIDIPNADPETQSMINSTLNTEESVSMQIFWLLFANSFFADNNLTTSSNVNVGLTTGAAVTGIEFLSNQISNWISNDKFNLGINYRPKSDLTSDEVELSVSAPILKDKLLLDVEGNYDFNNNNAYTTESFNNLSGDFSLTWMLDNSGNLRTKAFSRQINTFDENQGLQESGVGIYYKEDFNRFSDLVQKYKKNWAQRKKRLEIKQNAIDSLGRKVYIRQKRQENKAARQANRQENRQ